MMNNNYMQIYHCDGGTSYSLTGLSQTDNIRCFVQFAADKRIAELTNFTVENNTINFLATPGQTGDLLTVLAASDDVISYLPINGQVIDATAMAAELSRMSNLINELQNRVDIYCLNIAFGNAIDSDPANRAGKIICFDVQGNKLDLDMDKFTIATQHSETLAAAEKVAEDAAQTADDRRQTGEDRVATAADVVTTTSNKGLAIAAADRAVAYAVTPEDVMIGEELGGGFSARHYAAKTAKDKASCDLYKQGTSADAQATAADRVATGADRVQTGLDAVQAAEQAGIATAKANEAESHSMTAADATGVAINEANRATAQAQIAISKSGEASISASNASNSEMAAYNHAISAGAMAESIVDNRTVQNTGQSTTDIMSQKAVSDALNAIPQPDLTNYVEKNNSNIAIGEGAATTGDSVVLGRYAKSIMANSVAIGRSAEANNSYSVALGFNATGSASAGNSITVGRDASTTADNAIAVGYDAKATALRSTAVGHHSDATGSDSAAFGPYAMATGTEALSFGKSSQSRNNSSVAIGAHSTAANNNAIAIGKYAWAVGSAGIAIGYDTKAEGMFSAAFGYDAETPDDWYSMTIGNYSRPKSDAVRNGRHPAVIGSGFRGPIASPDMLIDYEKNMPVTCLTSQSVDIPNDMSTRIYLSNARITFAQLNADDIESFVSCDMMDFLSAISTLTGSPVRTRTWRSAHHHGS